MSVSLVSGQLQYTKEANITYFTCGPATSETLVSRNCSLAGIERDWTHEGR
jgi:hypothetical protein